jgi:CRP-like cAMP-binding protein
MMSGIVRVTTVDQDHQEVLVDEPRHGDFFGFCLDAGRYSPPDHRTSVG